MALTENEDQYLQRVLELYDEDRNKVTQWERNFMDDQVKRYEEGGEGISMSPKQWMIIQRIADKLGAV